MDKIDSLDPLAPPASHFLSAAIGWLELGNWRESLAELEQISHGLRSRIPVLIVRYEIHAKAEQWDEAAAIAQVLAEMKAEHSQFHILHAYATRRKAAGGIPKATEILSQARLLFPKEPLICYNLACYECQSGNAVAALEWFRKASALGDAKRFKALALKDPDLQPLWTVIAKS